MIASVLSPIVEPGFFSTSAVTDALAVGGAVAWTSALVGNFTVMRRHAFAGEALGDVGATGGSAAFLLGTSPLWGFMTAALVAAGVIDVAGDRRSHDRDLATGIVLGAALGLAALFLYFDSTHSSTTGVSMTVLFGSLFVINPSVIPIVLGLCAGVVGVELLLHRVLLLVTLSPDLATARGVPVRWVDATYFVLMATSVALAALTIGAVLSTALLIGPPAAALQLAKRPGRALLLAGCIGTAATWLGILLAYDSYDWPPVGHGWPVSFFIVTLVFVIYLGAMGARHLGARASRGARPGAVARSGAGGSV